MYVKKLNTVLESIVFIKIWMKTSQIQLREKCSNHTVNRSYVDSLPYEPHSYTGFRKYMVEVSLWDAGLLQCVLFAYFFIQQWDFYIKSSRNPIIRKMVTRIANYPDRLGPSGKHFLTAIVLHLNMASIFPNC